MRVHTIEDRVLVKLDKVGSETAGGIIVPDAYKREEADTGTIVQLSASGPITKKGEYRDMPFKVGDHVFLRPQGGTEIKLDGELYHVFREEDIYAILED